MNKYCQQTYQYSRSDGAMANWDRPA